MGCNNSKDDVINPSGDGQDGDKKEGEKRALTKSPSVLARRSSKAQALQGHTRVPADVDQLKTKCRTIKTLENLLKDHLGASYFLRYSQAEYSSENPEFWQVAQEYIECDDVARRKKLAKEAWDNYVKAGATFEINLKREDKELIEKKLDEAPSDLFLAAQKMAYHYMDHDTYPRFKKTLFCDELVLLHLSTTVSDELCVPLFSEYLQQQGKTADAVGFWAAAEEYQALEDQSARKAEAGSIYNKFLVHSTLEENGVTVEMQETIKSQLPEAPPMLFDRATTAISQSLGKIYADFLDSPLGEQYLAKIELKRIPVQEFAKPTPAGENGDNSLGFDLGW